MLKIRILLILSPLLIYFILPSEDQLANQASGRTPSETDLVSFPCSGFHIDDSGVECESSFNSEVHLDFPIVNLQSVLSGDEFLPLAEEVFHFENIVAGTERFRGIEFGLRWQPVTPDFLQIHLKEYLPYWGERVPYRLFWSMSYQVCPIADCDVWATMEQSGEILPSDIPDLDSKLAADVNYNGVPAGFWNNNIIR
jgi:hypothetical protein